MSLREQLRDLLPDFLPVDAANAVKGTDLIKQVRMRLTGDYSDATLRYHFSILCYDPTSPIAKVEQGQGYYLRQTRRQGAVPPALQGWFDRVGDAEAAVWLRFDRVMAIYERVCMARGSYPFVLNGRCSRGPELAGDWEVPDLVVADWDLETESEGEEERGFDRAMMRLRGHLAVREVGVTGVQVKLSTSLATCRADFFQALSATGWAQRGELVIAESLQDGALVAELRRLGHEFGVGVMTLGLETSRLDGMALPDEIRDLDEGAFEQLTSKLATQWITPSTRRASLDWDVLTRLRGRFPALEEMVEWMGDCVEAERPIWRRVERHSAL